MSGFPKTSSGKASCTRFSSSIRTSFICFEAAFFRQFCRAVAHPHRSCPEVSSRRMASLVERKSWHYLSEVYPLEAAIQFSRCTGKVSSIGRQREGLFMDPFAEFFRIFPLIFRFFLAGKNELLPLCRSRRSLGYSVFIDLSEPSGGMCFGTVKIYAQYASLSQA